MEVAIIGTGNVGRAVFHDLQHVNMISEISLIGRNRKKAEAEVVDAKDAAVLWEEERNAFLAAVDTIRQAAKTEGIIG